SLVISLPIEGARVEGSPHGSRRGRRDRTAEPVLGLGVTRKVKESVPAGKADLWAISGHAGDQITVRVKTRDDNGNGASNLHPALTLLGADLTPVADTIVRNVPCAVPNVCGASCQAFTRSLPFNGTYYIEVGAAVPASTCGGGLYRLLVTSPNGTIPTRGAGRHHPVACLSPPHA